MKIFTNKDIKNFFVAISCIFGGFILMFTLLFYGTLNLAMLFLSLLAALCILGVCFLYFRKQNQIMEEAVSQINLYLSGNTDIRIDCDKEAACTSFSIQ